MCRFQLLSMRGFIQLKINLQFSLFLRYSWHYTKQMKINEKFIMILKSELKMLNAGQDI